MVIGYIHHRWLPKLRDGISVIPRRTSGTIRRPGPTNSQIRNKASARDTGGDHVDLF